MNFYKAILSIRDHLLSEGIHLQVIEDCNKMLDYLDNQEKALVINREEARALREFLFNCGYISYEFHPEVHKFYNKVDAYVQNQEDKDTTQVQERP